MKKRWLLVVLAVMIAAVMGIAIACDDDEKPQATTYTVTVDYSSDLGTVEITNKTGEARTSFKSGEGVTVTVTPDEGYIVSVFKVNGEDAALENGKYTFKISKNTTVSIEYDIATYTVSTVYTADRGTVAVKDENGNAKTTFNHGDTVVITPTVSADYVVVSVKVGGVAIEPENGDYTFIIKQNAEVEVAFGIPAITQAILDTSNANLNVEGTNVYTEEGRAPLTYVKKTVFGTDSIYVEEILNGSVDFAETYVNEGGKLALVKHTIHNEIETVRPQTNDDFEEYYNPFALLYPEDFETTDRADVFKISDAQRARDAATALSGWSEAIAVFEVTVKDGKLTEAYIETAEMASSGVRYKSVYNFTFTEHGTAELDHDLLNPYAHKAEHDLLSAALTEMAGAESYTISYLDHEDGYVDIVYTIYVTNDLIYENCPNEENGYAKVGNKVYPFLYNKGGDPEITLLDQVRGITEVSQLKAGFVGNYAKELFELTEVGDGYKVFTLRYDCGDFAGDIFSEFGDGVDKMKYYGYALSGSITLDENDKLMSVTFDCYVYGSYSTVTLTYNDVNNTEIHEDFDFSDYAKVSKFDDWVGTYVDKYDGLDMYVVIDTDDGITIYKDGTGVIVNAVGGMLSDYFIISYEGESLYFMMKSEKILSIFSEKYFDGDVSATYYEFILESYDTVIVPAEYRATWSGWHYGEMTFVSGTGEDEVVYEASTNTVTAGLYYGDEYSGECYIVGSAAEVLDSVTFTFGDTENLVFDREIAANEAFAGDIIPTKYTGKYVCVQEIVPGVTVEHVLYIGVDADGNDSVVIDSRYAEEVYVEITATTIDLDGDEVEVLSYDATDGLVGYWGGLTLYFEINDDGALVIKMVDGIFDIFDYCIFDEKEVYDGLVIPDLFIGRWEGEDVMASMTYTLVVTDRTITLQITDYKEVGDVMTAEITEVDDYSVTFTVDGDEYTLGEMYGNMYLVTESANVKLTAKGVGPVNPKPDDTTIPDLFIGEWEGSDYYDATSVYTVVITAEQITVQNTVDGTAGEVKAATVTKVENTNWGYVITITIDGDEFTLAEEGDDISYATPDYSIYATLIKK